MIFVTNNAKKAVKIFGQLEIWYLESRCRPLTHTETITHTHTHPRARSLAYLYYVESRCLNNRTKLKHVASVCAQIRLSNSQRLFIHLLSPFVVIYIASQFPQNFFYSSIRSTSINARIHKWKQIFGWFFYLKGGEKRHGEKLWLERKHAKYTLCLLMPVRLK